MRIEVSLRDKGDYVGVTALLSTAQFLDPCTRDSTNTLFRNSQEFLTIQLPQYGQFHAIS